VLLGWTRAGFGYLLIGVVQLAFFLALDAAGLPFVPAALVVVAASFFGASLAGRRGQTPAGK
jgi:uncharacterized membrane protein